MRFLFVRPEVCPLVSRFPASGFLQIPPHDGHPCLRLYPSRYRADSGLSPVGTCARRAHLSHPTPISNGGLIILAPSGAVYLFRQRRFASQCQCISLLLLIVFFLISDILHYRAFVDITYGHYIVSSRPEIPSAKPLPEFRMLVEQH